MAAHQRKRPLVSLPALAATGFFVVVAFSWIGANFAYEPRYGDTPEYWRLASTLALDSWRTIGYPLVLRAAQAAAHSTGLARVGVYTLQTVMSLVALTYFFSVFAQVTKQRRNLKRDCLLALLVIITPPLAHLDISILSDSFANSLFILGAAAIHLVHVSERFTYAPLAVAVVGIVGSGTMRQDRLLIFALVVLGLSIWALNQRRLQKAAIMGLLLLVCVGVNQFNRHTQSAPGRPAISVSFMAFDRTARTHMRELLPYMPEAIRERITPRDAARWDVRQSYWATIARELDDRAGHAAMLPGAAVAWRHEGGSIATQVLIETVQYLATPVAYIAQTVFPSVGYTGNTASTNRHITERTGTLGRVYLWSFVVAALLVGLLAARRTANLKGVLPFWGFVVVVNALVNVFSSSVGFHIRYALPIFSIEIALVVWLASQALVSGRGPVSTESISVQV